MSDYTLHDIYHVVFLLRQRLVPDVIRPILEYANVFYRQTTYSTSSAPSGSRSTDIMECESPYTFVSSDPIKSSARLFHPVREVIFKIESCDQGWATGSGTWTWFTAAITPSKHVESEQGNLLENSGCEGLLIREKEVLKNERARGSFKHNIIMWSIDAPDEEEREWVQSLQNGDKIVVRAWAKFPGWVNRVRSIEVEVHMAAVI